MRTSISALFVTLFLLGTGSACSSVSYLLQAGKGQFELFNRARPISEVLHDETTPPNVRRLLNEVPKVKVFGEKWGLKPTTNYEKYVALDRPYVVTVVAASEELSFHSKKWDFPIVGSFPYLGFFNPERAKKYGEELRKEGWDVEVRGASAYSTLGWFSDPLLSSMLTQGEDAFGDLVDVVLHESVHASHYVDDQSYYNESLASFIAEGLTPLYLASALGLESAEERAYAESLTYAERVNEELHATYAKLEKVYGAAVSDAEKRTQKVALLGDVRTRLKLRRDLNNASLIQFKTYRSGRATFQRLHERCGKDWRRTIRTLFSVGKNAFPAEQVEAIDPVLDPIVCLSE